MISADSFDVTAGGPVCYRHLLVVVRPKTLTELYVPFPDRVHTLVSHKPCKKCNFVETCVDLSAECYLRSRDVMINCKSLLDLIW